MKYDRAGHYFKFPASGNLSKAAIIYEGAQTTYKDLQGFVRSTIDFLRKRGIGKDDTVAVLMENSAEFVTCFFSFLACRSIMFPINPNAPDKELRSFLIESGASYVICNNEDVFRRIVFHDTFVNSVMLVKLQSGKLMLKELARFKNRKKVPASVSVADRKSGSSILLYSSGSTGKPKYVPVTTRNLFYQAFQFSDALGLTKKDIFAAAIPFYHSYGLLNILAAFYLGATLLIIKKFIPHTVVRLIDEYKATVFLATPFLLGILADSYKDGTERGALKTLIHCISSTGLLREKDYSRFYERYKIPVFVQYGSTETGAATISLDKKFRENVVGRPLKGVTIGIFDDDYNPIPRGTAGRIGIKSPAACRYYLGNETQTNISFNGGYAFPGDIGYMDKKDVLHIIGRSDIINVGGLKVDRIEVEKALSSFPHVKEAVVFGANEGSTQTVRAAIVTSGKVVERALLSYLKGRLADYKVPKKIIFLKDLPRDEKGKVLKERLESL